MGAVTAVAPLYGRHLLQDFANSIESLLDAGSPRSSNSGMDGAQLLS